MTKIISILFSLLFSFGSCSQTDTQSYLETYGKIWGFLKYFHPKPSKLDWDQVLIDDFEQLKSCNKQVEFDQLIEKLIMRCGKFKPHKRNLDEYTLFRESVAWFESKVISKAIREELNQLYLNKPKFKNKYVSSVWADNPNFKNEKEHTDAHLNEGVRYLAITRYWNVINYYYPNRSIISQDWNEVYSELLPDMLMANSPQEYELVLRRLSSKIEDGHGFVRTEGGSVIDYNYLPFYCLNLEEGTFISYVNPNNSKTKNLKKFDRIVSIDGLGIEEYWENLGNRISVSNNYYLLNSTYYFRQTLKDSVEIIVERDGSLHTNIIYPTKHIGLYSVDSVFPVERETGLYTDSISDVSYAYIDLGTFKRRNATRKFKKSLEHVDHLIINARNYPNWTMYALGNSLIRNKTIFARFRKMNFDFPSSFTFQNARKVGGARKGYDGTIYILVDHETISQGEFTVMALQNHPKAITIGGQTAGADGNLSSLPMPNGYSLSFSGLGVFYPDGTDTQKVGVRRDIRLMKSMDDLKSNTDHLLNAALEIIRMTEK